MTLRVKILALLVIVLAWAVFLIPFVAEQVGRVTAGREAVGVSDPFSSLQQRVLRTLARPRHATRADRYADFLKENRIPPDGRFVYAFAALATLKNPGAPFKPATVESAEQGGWKVKVGDRVIARLPDVPNFQDYMQSLEAYAADGLRLPPDRGQGAPPYSFQPSLQTVVQSLDRLEDGWRTGEYGPAALKEAARYMLDILRRRNDPLSRDNEVAGQAAALVALARVAVPGDPLTRERAILAYAMDYDASAQKLAQSLDPTDPLRAFVSRDVEALRELANGTDLESKFLYLSFWEKPYQGEGLRSDILDTDFDWFLGNTLDASFNTAPVEGMSVAATYAQTGNFAPYGPFPLAPSLHALITQFQADLPRVEKFRKGHLFFPARVTRAFLEQSFFGELFSAGVNAVDSLASRAALADVRSALNPQSPVAMERQLAVLFKLMDSKLSLQAPSVSVDDAFAALQGVGRYVDERLIYLYLSFVPYGNWEQALHARDLYMRRVDMQPRVAATFSSLSSTAWGGWLDPEAEEFYTYLAVELQGLNDADTLARILYGEGATSALSGMLASPLTPFQKRLLTKLDPEILAKAPPERVRALFEGMIRDFPVDFSLTRSYYHYLEHKSVGDYAAALVWIRKWLKVVPDKEDFSIVMAKGAETFALRKMGRLQEAMATASPYLSSWQGGLLNEAALVLAEKGDLQGALSLLNMARRRYPGTGYIQVSRLLVLWRMGKTKEAAELAFELPRYKVNMDEVVSTFREAFPKDTPEAQAAVQAMISRVGSPFGASVQALAEISGFLNGLRKQGRGALAWKARKDLQPFFTRQNYTFFFSDWYRDAMSGLGDAEALAWFNTLPLEGFDRNELSVGFAEDVGGDYEPVWGAIPAPEKGMYPEYVWITRAVAEGLKGFPDRDRLTLLRDTFKSFPYTNYVVEAGRSFLDLQSEELAVQRTRTNKELVEICYFLAMKAVANKDYYRAADLFKEALSIPGVSGNRVREIVWSTYALDSWAGGDAVFLSRRTSFR